MSTGEPWEFFTEESIRLAFNHGDAHPLKIVIDPSYWKTMPSDRSRMADVVYEYLIMKALIEAGFLPKARPKVGKATMK